MTFSQIYAHWQEYAAAIGGFFVAVALLWSRIKPILVRSYVFGKATAKFFKDLNALIEKVDAMQVKVDGIHKEVKPNHGSSMRDEVREIRSSQITSDARDQAKFNLSDEPLWETNAQGKVIRVNRRYCELVGRSAEDVLGNNWKLTIHPDDLTFVATEWEHIVNDGRDSVIKHRILKPDGTIIPVIGKGEAMTGPQGDVLGWTGTLSVVPPQAVEAPIEVLKRPRLLMVEDSEDTSSAFKLLLNPYFDVKLASSGRDAIQTFTDALMQSHPFDAVLMDYAMPDMDGMETVKQLREREPTRYHTKIIFVTGNEHLISDEDIAIYRIADVIKKPTDPIKVAAHVLSLLGRSH